MPPIPGTRLGVYDIAALLGEGGMGQVYRATDTNLKRQVAIKVLPGTVAADADRLARFQREAEVLAALNHPNIAQIYGLEKSEGTIALVMELVEGEDLSRRIAHGALPVDEALPIAKQIAEALEAAHEQGIVHRDLKPANIKVRADGTVKVLDFGLAKALDPVGAESAAPGASLAPTITSPAITKAGVIFGTAAYMSPEQARGKFVDRRADIWAFGCVLYEMLTGRRAFRGEDVTDTLALVVRGEPDWNALPSGLSPVLSRHLRLCFVKDPKQRIHDIADVRLALEGAFDAVAPPVTQTPVRTYQRPAIVATLAAVSVMSIAVAGWALWSGSRSDVRPPIRLTLTIPSDDELDVLSFAPPGLALSPDGRVLVYAARRNGVAQLFHRPLDQFSSAPIGGTDGAVMPFFSPDGQWIGFFAGGAIKKVQSAGGESITIAKAGAGAASWGADDAIVYSVFSNGAVVRQVSAAGGEGIPLTQLDAARGDVVHQVPEVLPGARAVLFTAFPAGKIFARSLADGAEKELIEGRYPRYVPTGHLAFVRGTSLWAAPFNAERLEVTGPAVRLLDGIIGPPIVARDGTLVYTSGVPFRMELVWVTRQGVEAAVGLDPADFADVVLSPDGHRLLVSRGSFMESRIDLWIGDLTRRIMTRLTTEAGINAFPLWTQDGRSVVYSATLEGGRNIFRRQADGSGKPERLTKSVNQQSPWTWSKDGKTLVLNEIRQPNGYALTTVPADGGSETVLYDSPRSDRTPAVSPDGRWIAYQTDESGRTEVVVRPFPNVNDRRWQVSTEGGGEPKWSASGRELFYRQGNAVMAVAIGDDPASARLEKLFQGDYIRSSGEKSWDVAPDGRFLMRKGVRASYSINVVLNWTEELKTRVPTR